MNVLYVKLLNNNVILIYMTKSIKKWKNIKPESNKSRKNVYDKFGSSCFLDSKRLKYPICNKLTGKKECIGHYAAQYYLNINKGKLNNKKNKKSIKKRKKYTSLLNKSKLYTKKYCTKK